MSQIEFRNITKKYGENVVLNDVSFNVDDGEFVFIVGPSGAGKSTLIKLLTREEFPTEGSIFFTGFNLENVDEKDQQQFELSAANAPKDMLDVVSLPSSLLPELRRRIAVVFQDFKALKSKTVFENVAVALEVADKSENEITEVVPNVLGLVGLSGQEDKFPKQLSGGELQRMSIARALAHEPDVLVADEPTGMIDPDAAREVIEVLEKINSLGTTVIMATHDFTIVNRLEKRVVRLERGKVTSDKKKGKYNE